MDIGEIQRRARKGPRALLARRAFAVCIGLIATVVIPRFVPPRAYGLAAMSAAIFALAEMFKDFGLTNALLRKGDIRPAEISFLFWFNAAATVALTVLIALAAPLAAIFFGEPMVAPVMLASLVGFAAGGLSLQHRSVMIRDLRFDEMAVIDGCTILLQFAVTLAVAVVTHDVWAIVAGSVAAGLLGAGLNIVVSRWKPGPPQWLPEARTLFAFGANTSLYAFSIFAANNVAAILIGRLFGPAPLGQYNRAVALQVIPANNAVGPLAQAVLPVLAGLRSEAALYRKTYLDLVRHLNMIALPAAVLMTLAGPPLAVAALGPQWVQSGLVLQALGPAVAALGFGYAVSDLFITQDRSKELGLLGLFELIFRLLGVAAGLPFGVVGAAAGFSASTLIVVLIRIAVAGRSGPVSFGDHLAAAAPALPLALGALIGGGTGLYGAVRLALEPLPAAIAICGLGALFSGVLGLAVAPSRRALLGMAAALRGSA